MERLTKLANADALLFISGVDHISTAGRVALMALMTLILSAPVPGPFGGGQWGGLVIWPPPGTTTLSVALVDGKTGALLWYNVGAFGGLTYPDSAANLTEQIFRDLPLGARPTWTEYDWSGSPKLGVAPH